MIMYTVAFKDMISLCSCITQLWHLEKTLILVVNLSTAPCSPFSRGLSTYHMFDRHIFTYQAEVEYTGSFYSDLY